MAKSHILGGLKQVYFLTILEARSPRSWGLHCFWCGERSLPPPVLTIFSRDHWRLRAHMSKLSVVLVRVPILSWGHCSYELMCVHAKSLQSCLTLRNPMDCSLPGSSVYGILQARILEWVAISFSRGSSRPRNWTQVLHSRQILYQLSYEGSPNAAYEDKVSSSKKFTKSQWGQW